MRKLKIAVISDVHLATHASKAKSLLKYLKSINPEKLVLNGDFIDSWRFTRNYFPKPHLKVLRQLIKMMEKGVEVVYITGNHDEIFRKFNNTKLGNFCLVNQLELELDGNKTWIFHGDIFDGIIHQAKWLAKFGAAAYGFLTLFNKLINLFFRMFRKKDVIIYKSLKEGIRKDRTKLNQFEHTVVEAAAFKEMDNVICGHTHVPVDKMVVLPGKTVRYINCGDWVEHHTAAEYENGEWTLVYFKGEVEDDENNDNMNDEIFIQDKKQLYKSILEEFEVASMVIKVK